MTDARTPSLEPVVVGVDGSTAARAAARWAAAVAEKQGTTLHLVHVLTPPPVFYTEPRPLPSEDEDRIAAETFLAGALRGIRADRRALAVECSLPTGSTAADILLPLADSASMVVIGSTARGPVEGYLNATALRLAHHSPCPLVVWRGAEEHAIPDRRAVVVGVDGSRCSVAAVADAFQFAGRFDAPLIAVHSWRSDFPHDTENAAVGVGAVLAESLAGWVERYPDVVVREIVESGGAGEVLLRWCEDAQLLVVGSHGHGALGRAILGSTSQDMLHRARCPVMISKVHRDTGSVHDRATEFGDRGRR
ncbi:universal stress protein [Rhodococcus opacus]|uniref:Universal stress protein n=1 Tax=Rhodococcus opacus TaxID=37919 RepID=A0AAX3YQM6_RHOOP|nr:MULTISPECIES: universal stress protein [Rhodococcus]MCZ4584341.1 universal stress protein [Rhodococcus opacus]MDI9941239.1 universal stress protein [Rhodococcus sp. IEGM 1351]WLF50774.1 universal stress protein [Rhodococcus opacus]